MLEGVAAPHNNWAPAPTGGNRAKGLPAGVGGSAQLWERPFACKCPLKLDFVPAFPWLFSEPGRGWCECGAAQSPKKAPPSQHNSSQLAYQTSTRSDSHTLARQHTTLLPGCRLVLFSRRFCFPPDLTSYREMKSKYCYGHLCGMDLTVLFIE